MQRCPVCAAEGVTPPQCRRCKADLELVAQAESALRCRACESLLKRDFAAAKRIHYELQR